MYGFAGIFIGLAITRLFFYLSELFIDGYYINHSFYGNPNEIYPVRELMSQIGYISATAGFLMFFYLFEMTILKTRYTLTIINIFFLVIIIILPFQITKIFVYIGFFTDGMLFFLILFFLAKKSSAEFQGVLTLLLFGFIIMMAGHVLNSSVVKFTGVVPLWFPPTLYIIGAIIAISPTVINPKYFSRGFFYWSSFSIFFVILMTLGVVFLLTYTITGVYYFIFSGGIIIAIPIMVYSLFRTIKIIKNQGLEEEVVDSHNLLEVFTKPKKITEEEISISKEKKICLVCKGKVSRKNIYLCPDCNAFYCLKCSNSLTLMENACWVCNTPFDESRPVNVLDKSVDIDIIDEEHKAKYIKNL